MSVITTERVGRTSVLTIQRPEARNALTREVIRGLAAAFDAAGQDPEVRAVVLTGAGGHFCAGADLRKTFQEDPDLLENLETYMDEYHAVIKAIVRCPKPCIASVDGAAVGSGGSRARVRRARRERSGVPAGEVREDRAHARWGGTFWLPRLLGTARAMQAILFAEKLEAAELKSLGLVMKVVPAAELREATMAVAREIEAGPPLAFREIKAAVYGSWGAVEDALRREREGQLKLLRSADALEGNMAWAQKREPQFVGK